MDSVAVDWPQISKDMLCDVCRSPDREQGNEKIICSQCSVCVHQACYGVWDLPLRTWKCRPCVLNIQPECDLCPKTGGALKPTNTGRSWAHLSCALWIPEVSFASVKRMEPITKINNIPTKRWNLVCSLCSEGRGVCIQCHVDKCEVAYHVTCAFKNCLQMEPIYEEDGEIKLISFCPNHSERSGLTGSNDDGGRDCIR